MRTRLNTRHPRQRQQGNRWDISRLDLPNNERQYQSLIQNKLQTLEEEETSTPDLTIDQKWQNITNAIESAAAETIGKERNNKKKNQWFDQECEQSLQQKAIKRLELLTRPTEENREDYNRVRTQTRRLLRRKKKQYLEARIQQLEEEHRTGQSRQFYRDLKTMTGNTINSPRFIKDDAGQLLTDDEEISRQWRKYFEQLLNTENPTTTGQQRQYQLAEPEIPGPTLAEVKSAISSLKNHKAPGPDGIQAELLKKGGEKLHLEIYHLIREVWEREEIPKHWHESHIIPIHKKGDKQICRNYRGISLINTTYKIISIILFRRLTPYAEEIIGDYQSGFRPGRSTIDQIFVLRQVLEKNWEFNRDVHQIFVDFKQAYDSVSREALWETMVEMGVPGKLVRLAKVSTENASARIRIGSTTSEEFLIDTGLRQGDPLAPLLFNFALEHAVRKAQPQLTNGFAAQGSKILLAFADDVDTIAQSTRDAKEVFTLFENGAKEVGLKVNEDKTKYMVVTKNPRPRVRQNVTINEYNFEVVKEFKYLGAIITSENKYEKDVAARIIAGNRAYYSLRTLLKSKILSRPAKIRVYKTIIRPTITYGSETWTLNQRETTKLLVLERKILRTIYGPCREETTGEWRRRHNDELQTIYGDENIVRYIKANRIRWAGHVLRSSDERLLNATFWERPDGKRSVGRPRNRWKDAVASDLRKMGVQQWEIAAQDRQQWREIVNAAKTHIEL